jgi:hypothetical protein
VGVVLGVVAHSALSVHFTAGIRGQFADQVRSRVVLPIPFGPMIATRSPAST